MKLTKIKTTVMAGVLAASMVLPGMTALAATNISATTTVPDVNKYVQVAKSITISDDIEFKIVQVSGANADKTVQPKTISGEYYLTIPADTINAADIASTDTTTADTHKVGYESNGANKKSSVSIGDAATKVAEGETAQKLVDQITEVGEYTFALTETAPAKVETGYGWYSTDSVTYYLHVYKKADSNDLEWLVTTSNEMNEAGTAYEGKVSSLDFLNKYSKKGNNDGSNSSLVISKTVATTDYYDGSAFTFDVTFTGSNTAVVPTDGYAYTKTGDDTVYYAKAKDTITLTDGQSATFSDIPAGITVSVTEEAKTNVKKTDIKVTMNGTEKATELENKTATGNQIIGEGANTIAYTNTYSDVTVTGVVTSIAPYVTLVVLAVAAVAAYMAMKSRVAR